MKIRYACKRCGDIFYHAGEAIRHNFAEHPEIGNCSPEEQLDNFNKSHSKWAR